MATNYNIGTTSLGVGGNENQNVGTSTFTNQAISQLGYNLGLGGMGISQPVGTPYNVNQTPAAVYGGYAGPGFKPNDTTIKPTYTDPGMPQTGLPAVGGPQPQTQSQQQDFSSGFDMKYYPGWGYTEALADWKATGGAKGRTSTGGTGGGNKSVSTTGDPRAATVLGDPTANQDFQNSGMNIDQYLSTIDQESQNSLNFLNEQESAIRAEQPGIEQGITDQADLLRNKAGTVKEDAQSAARRLYSELQQGYKQRFGGASSAGEAAMALTNNEQQRQMAQNNRTYQDAVSQVDLSASQAVNSAQSEFRNRLLQITQNRTQVEGDKLAARRQALSDLSTKVFQIQQQRETFKQNLQLMQEQARLQSTNALSGLNVNPTSNLTFSGNQTSASGNKGLQTAQNSVGNISSGITKNQDQLGSGILGQYNPNSTDYFLNQR